MRSLARMRGSQLSQVKGAPVNLSGSGSLELICLRLHNLLELLELVHGEKIVEDEKRWC